MTVSIKRIRAIMMKDWKSFLKNYYILISAVLPLGMALILGDVSGSMATLVITMALAMTGSFVQASMMAEEKEKNTLRVLLLSPATATEIMIGKSILTGAITVVVVILSCMISGIILPNFIFTSIMILLLLVFFLALGTIVGLLSRSINEASIVVLPVILLFTYGTFVTQMVNNEIVTVMFNALPTEHFKQAFIALNAGGNFSDISKHMLYILIWTVITVALTLVLYKKRRFDN